MKKQEIEKSSEEFIPYEEARIKKESDQSEIITDNEVESVNKLLSPDENSFDSRG